MLYVIYFFQNYESKCVTAQLLRTTTVDPVATTTISAEAATTTVDPAALSQTETGALATAPLTSVVNAATNALYEDLHNLVHGEIKIVSVAANLNNAALGEAGVAATAGSSGIIASANKAGNHNNAIASSVEDKLTAAALGARPQPVHHKYY